MSRITFFPHKPQVMFLYSSDVLFTNIINSNFSVHFSGICLGEIARFKSDCARFKKMHRAKKSSGESMEERNGFFVIVFLIISSSFQLVIFVCGILDIFVNPTIQQFADIGYKWSKSMKTYASNFNALFLGNVPEY